MVVNVRHTWRVIAIVERFTGSDADTIDYQITVEDLTTHTKPWTATIPMKKLGSPIYEYACHEGNYAMRNILAGARAPEGKGASTPIAAPR